MTAHPRFRFAIGTKSFPTKGAAAEEIRRILHAAELDQPLRGADAVLIRDLFELHPRGAEKVALGVDGVVVKLNRRDGATARGFHVIHPDGTTTGFSYKPCLTPSSDKPSALAAMRGTILLSQRRVRVAAFLRSGRALCAHCQIWIDGTARGEVHHEPLHTFGALAAEWLRLNGEPEIVHSADWGDDFKSAAAKQSWIAFHDARARRVVICQPCHYRATHPAK